MSWVRVLPLALIAACGGGEGEPASKTPPKKPPAGSSSSSPSRSVSLEMPDFSSRLGSWYGRVDPGLRKSSEAKIEEHFGTGWGPDPSAYAGRIGALLGKLAHEDAVPIALFKLEDAGGRNAAALLMVVKQIQQSLTNDLQTVRSRDSISPLDALMVGAVARRVQDPDAAVRRAAVDALELMAARFNLMFSSDARVRKIDADSARRIEVAFEKAAKDADPAIRDRAAGMLKLLKKVDPAQSAAPAAPKSLPRKSLDQMLAGTSPASTEYRIDRALEGGGDALAVGDRLRETLKDRDFHVAAAALLKKLQTRKGAAAAALLVALRLRLANPGVIVPEDLRDVHLACADVVPPFASDPDRGVRLHAVSALAAVADPVVALDTGKVIETLDAAALRRLRTAFETASRDPDAEVRKAAEKGLEELQGR